MVIKSIGSKSKLAIISLGLIISIGLGIFLAVKLQNSQQQPPTKPKPTSPTSPPKLAGEKLSGKVSFANNIFIPATAVFVEKEKYTLNDSVIKNVSAIIGFSEEEKIPTSPLAPSQSSWSSKKHFLTISKTNNLVQFGTYIQSNPEMVKGALPSVTSATKTTLEWLGQMSQFIPDISSVVPETSYYLFGGEHPRETSDVKLAQAIKVDFYPTIKGLKIFGVNPKDPPIRVIIGPNDQVLFASIYLGINNIRAGKEFQVKSFQRLQENIFSEGKIVSVKENEGDVTPDALTDYQKIDISDIILGYSWQSANSMIEPVLVLSGSATRSSGGAVDITILVPAK